MGRENHPVRVVLPAHSHETGQMARSRPARSPSWRSHPMRGGIAGERAGHTTPRKRHVPHQVRRTVDPGHRGAGTRAQEVPLRPGPHGLRGRRHHRHRHLRPHRTGRQGDGGPRHRHRVRRGGRRVRAGRALLRRVRLHGPRGKLRVHLRLRRAGRTGGLDHRLGPGAGVRAGHRGGRGRLVRLRPLTDGQRRLDDARSPFWDGRGGRIRLRHPGLRPGAGPDRHPGRRHEAVCPGHLGRGGDQGRGGPHGDHRGSLLHQGRELQALHPARREAAHAAPAGTRRSCSCCSATNPRTSA